MSSNENGLNRVHKMTATFEFSFEFDVKTTRKDFDAYCTQQAHEMFQAHFDLNSTNYTEFTREMNLRLEELE